VTPGSNAPTTTAPTAPSANEVLQAEGLTRARRRATGLLALVAAGFLGTFALPDGTGTGFLRAALEAGLVGGLADWFAVVALFRYPLGIPIPHTAVIPRSKDGLGANIVTFMRDNFLRPDQVRERLADPAHVERVGAWLSDPDHADRVAAQVAGGAVTLLDVLDEDELVARIASGLRDQLRRVPVARLAGEALDAAIREQRHAALVTATVSGLRQTIDRNRAPLRRRLGAQAPAWVPDAVNDLVFDRAEAVIHAFLQQLAADPDHELRRALDEQLLDITARLRTDPAVAEQVGAAVDGALADDLLHDWIRRWLAEVRAEVREAAAPTAHHAPLRRVVRDALVEFGVRLRGGGELHDRVLAVLDAIAPQVADVGQREIGGLISGTIERWDAEDTARRLELWMGRDLQFVRINGTVVGALVGLVLHAVTRILT
jgi:uncharacterized membrane-anchored protein YjiN (DUF445 family)